MREKPWNYVRTILLPPDLTVGIGARDVVGRPQDSPADPQAAARHATTWRHVRTILVPPDIVAVPRRPSATGTPSPQASEGMDAEAAAFYADAWRHIRFALLPQDIVAVRRQSGSSTVQRSEGRRSDSWTARRASVRPAPAGSETLRAGGREWFADNLFVEAQNGHAGLGYGTSLALHACCVAALAIFLALHHTVARAVVTQPSLVMKAWIAEAPPTVRAAAVLQAPAIHPAGYRPVRPEPAAAAPPPPPLAEPQPVALTAGLPAPVEAPASIGPEIAPYASGGPVEGGVPGGVPGGVAGGVVGGVPGGVVGGVVGGTMRVGPSMAAPRKIRDVRPVYPESALNERAHGNVILEIIVGPDGRVQAVKVLRSIPLLDQPALDAVRQWEYAPPTWNGQPVAVIVTVVVNFDIR